MFCIVTVRSDEKKILQNILNKAKQYKEELERMRDTKLFGEFFDEYWKYDDWFVADDD